MMAGTRFTGAGGSALCAVLLLTFGCDGGSSQHGTDAGLGGGSSTVVDASDDAAAGSGAGGDDAGTDAATPGGTLQFASGFEDAVYLQANDIRGIDATGPSGRSDWDQLPEYLTWPSGAGAYLQGGSLELTQDPLQPSNQVLHFHNISSEGNVTRTQWEIYQVLPWSDPGGPNLFEQQFYRYRMLIPTDIRDALAGQGWQGNYWYMIWEAHAWESEETRHGIYLRKHDASDDWYLYVMQQRPEGGTVTWENSDRWDVGLPFGEWFTLDVFFKYHPTDGRFFVAITPDGQGRQTVGDYVGQTQWGTKCKDQMVFKMYTSANWFDVVPGGTHQYYDDFEIWSDFPPGYF